MALGLPGPTWAQGGTNKPKVPNIPGVGAGAGSMAGQYVNNTGSNVGAMAWPASSSARNRKRRSSSHTTSGSMHPSLMTDSSSSRRASSSSAGSRFLNSASMEKSSLLSIT